MRLRAGAGGPRPAASSSDPSRDRHAYGARRRGRRGQHHQDPHPPSPRVPGRHVRGCRGLFLHQRLAQSLEIQVLQRGVDGRGVVCMPLVGRSGRGDGIGPGLGPGPGAGHAAGGAGAGGPGRGPIGGRSRAASALRRTGAPPARLQDCGYAEPFPRPVPTRPIDRPLPRRQPVDHGGHSRRRPALIPPFGSSPEPPALPAVGIWSGPRAGRTRSTSTVAAAPPPDPPSKLLLGSAAGHRQQGGGQVQSGPRDGQEL